MSETLNIWCSSKYRPGAQRSTADTMTKHRTMDKHTAPLALGQHTSTVFPSKTLDFDAILPIREKRFTNAHRFKVSNTKKRVGLCNTLGVNHLVNNLIMSSSGIMA
jgi:hypothetical protein